MAANRDELIKRIRETLAKTGFFLSDPHNVRSISFDIIARRDKQLLIIKALTNIDSLSNEDAHAIKEVKIAASLWLSAARKAGRKIPAPIVEKQFKCRFPLRLPGDLRRKLELEAKREGRLPQPVDPPENRLIVALLSLTSEGGISVAPGLHELRK